MTPYHTRITQSSVLGYCITCMYMYMYTCAVCKKLDEGFLQHVWIGSKTLINLWHKQMDLPHTFTCPQKSFFEDLEDGMSIAQL